MKVDITYPSPPKKSKLFETIINIVKWLLVVSIIISPITNIFVGKRAWSLLVLWPVYVIWRAVLERDTVEYNRISQTSKLLIYICILLR